MSDMILVIKVIDEYTVVINKGAHDGIKNGQKFMIYSLSNESIIDPSTGEDLGKLETVKGTARIEHLQERMATLVSSEYQTNVAKIIKKPSKSAFGFDMYQTKYTEEITPPPELLPFGDVQVGDYVKLI